MQELVGPDGPDDTAEQAALDRLAARLRAALLAILRPDSPVMASAYDDHVSPFSAGFSPNYRSDGMLLDAAHGGATKTRSPQSNSVSIPRAGAHSSRHRAGNDDAETTRMIALVELAKKGDAEAFGQLYDHYVSTIYRYIYYRVGTHALAEDLTSETFLRALRSLASFKWQGRDFGAWLVTISRNLVADHYKSGRFRLEVATGEILDHDSVSEGPEDDVLAAITNETLLKALGGLGHEQQECLVLRFLNGLTVAETARALGKTEGAIKQLQLRAIRNLAKQLPEGFR